MIPLHYVQQAQGDTPEDVLNRQIQQFTQSGAAEHSFGLHYVFEQYYLLQKPQLNLCALISLRRVQDRVGIAAAVLEAGDLLLDALPECANGRAAVEKLAAEGGAALVNLSAPLLLEPVAIPKPWGQEIWYTGIEERGLSRVTGNGGSTPLPWLLSVAPQRLTRGLERQITLLKILDPLPEPVFGDLYFEMHEEKQEVYVVTRIDPEAWPEGQGGIRFGFNAAQRAQYDTDQAFKAAYLAAVQAYERVRRAIDAQLDKARAAAGVALDAPVAADTLKTWLADLPAEQLAEEAQKRAAMEAYTAVKPLALGDVVKVPCFTPHSLQHGVQTVEFQTPVYERQILAFGQKVLTQSHWDTEAALEKVNIDTPAPTPLKLLSSSPGCKVEQVVDFDDFAVHRYTLSGEADCCLPAIDAYGVLMGVTGTVAVGAKVTNPPQVEPGTVSLAPQSACLLNPEQSGCLVRNRSTADAVLLLALPKQLPHSSRPGWQ